MGGAVGGSSSREGKWYELNDFERLEAKFRDIKEKQAYILCYLPAQPRVVAAIARSAVFVPKPQKHPKSGVPEGGGAPLAAAATASSAGAGPGAGAAAPPSAAAKVQTRLSFPPAAGGAGGGKGPALVPLLMSQAQQQLLSSAPTTAASQGGGAAPAPTPAAAAASAAPAPMTSSLSSLVSGAKGSVGGSRSGSAMLSETGGGTCSARAMRADVLGKKRDIREAENPLAVGEGRINNTHLAAAGQMGVKARQVPNQRGKNQGPGGLFVSKEKAAEAAAAAKKK